MNYRIVADSSSNLFRLEGADYAAVPLKICAGDREFVDTPDLDIGAMLDYLKSCKTKSGTSCPNAYDWMEAFGDAEMAFGVAITSRLSGSYGTGVEAAREYEASHPGARVYIHDSRSTGPEMQLLLEKLRDLQATATSFDEVRTALQEYGTHTHLLVSLESLTNLANNGRVSPLVAKMAGLLGIRIVSRASEDGVIEPLHKCRGQKRAMQTMLDEMDKAGYRGGKVRISHCRNEEAVRILTEGLRSRYPDCDIEALDCKGLCSYYAEEGGLILGFEDLP